MDSFDVAGLASGGDVRVLLLSRYSRNGASTRLRSLQYIPTLSSLGIDVVQAPFFDESYLERLYAKHSTLTSTLAAYTRRLKDLLNHARPDVIWLEKEALPWAPWFIERSLMPSDIPVITDYDDAVFHRYDQHQSPIIRQFLGKKIDSVMAASRLVMAGNHYLADRALQAGAKRVEVVPTVVDARAYSVERRSHLSDALRIGWVGTPGTWEKYMAPLMPMLTHIATDNNARLCAVGAGKSAIPHPLLDVLPWAEDTEVAQIQTMDVGLMPLDDSLWSRGKCGYKLIQYMACGLPVVASPVGVNCQIVEDGVNGFLASSETEWREAIRTLLCDAALCKRMGAAGRKKIEQHYSLQAWGPKVGTLLLETARNKKSARD